MGPAQAVVEYRVPASGGVRRGGTWSSVTSVTEREASASGSSCIVESDVGESDVRKKSVHGWLDDEEGDDDEDDDESGHMQVRLRGFRTEY